MDTSKREVLLTIRSRSEAGLVKQQTRGQAYSRDHKLMYRYMEPESELGRVTAVLKVEEGLVRLLRQGDVRSEQQFAPGRRLPGYYDLPHGRITLETLTSELKASLTPEGLGKLLWSYELFVDGEASGRFELRIDVEAAEDEPFKP